MAVMRRRWLVVPVLLATGGLATVRATITARALTRQAAQESGPATPIFNGRSFEGWEGDPAIFRIQDGAIVGGSLQTKLAHNEFLCTTRAFGDFELRARIRLLGGDSANAGIQFRTKRIPN